MIKRLSKSFYEQVVGRVVLLSTLSLLFAFLLLQQKWVFAMLALFFFVYQVILLIRFFNTTNRSLAYFFRAVENDDFTVRFSEQNDNDTIKDLHRGMNTINQHLLSIQVENENQEKYYQEILQQASIGILSFTKAGQVVFVNPTAEKLLNYRALNHLKQLQRVDEKLFQLFLNLKPNVAHAFQFSNEREQLKLTFKAKPLTLNGQALTLVIIQDIRAELADQETDSWERLIKVLTHEIMNSIAPITSLSESLLGYFKTEDGIVKAESLNERLLANTVKGLEVIKDQGENLSEFVRSYRSLRGISLPDKSLLSVEELFGKVGVMIEQEVGVENIEFSWSVAIPDLAVFADEQQISLVLVNLLKNAIQALQGQADGKIICQAYPTDDEKVMLQITDNGPGIATEILDQIFIPFFTTKLDGSGIGLSFSKQVARLHNGSLTLSSIPYEATIFSLKL
ncbi:MAG: PAS domain-containing sensor histidine kinase [Saprospiraceae bacterium]